MKTQECVARFIVEHSLETSIVYRALDVSSEAGEVAKAILHETSYGHRQMQSYQELYKELGDVYFALLALASQANIDLENALYDTLRKYEQRKDVTGCIASDNA